MHYTHVHDDFLLMYILFARRNHEHEVTTSYIHIICSDAYSQDTCNTLLALSCLCIHMLLHSILTWLHTCRGSLCMLHVFSKLYLLFSLSLPKALMYVVISYKKGEIESTSAPWVVLVINVNISPVGLMFLSRIFQTSPIDGVAWTRGCGTPSRC